MPRVTSEHAEPNAMPEFKCVPLSMDDKATGPNKRGASRETIFDGPCLCSKVTSVPLDKWGKNAQPLHHSGEQPIRVSFLHGYIKERYEVCTHDSSVLRTFAFTTPTRSGRGGVSGPRRPGQREPDGPPRYPAGRNPNE
jgi:hypothetical protein